MGFDDWEYISSDKNLTYLRSTVEFESLLSEKRTVKKMGKP